MGVFFAPRPKAIAFSFKNEAFHAISPIWTNTPIKVDSFYKYFVLQVKLRLEVAAPGSRNTREDGDVDCQNDVAQSPANHTDSFVFECRHKEEREAGDRVVEVLTDKAASKVIVKTTSYKDIAEIIIAGHKWGK